MSEYRVPDEIKRFPKLCIDCKWSEEDKGSVWRARCFNPKVVSKDSWALANNNDGQPAGSECREERAKRFAPCGQKGRLWEKR